MIGNLILKLKNGGRLYQAGVKEILENPNPGVDVIILAAAEFQRLPIITPTIAVPLNDNFFPSPDEFQRIWKQADMVANYVVDFLHDGLQVVNSCAKGWNRSGLVSGLTMVKLFPEVDSRIIISEIKNKRPNALNNPAFCKMIKMARDRV